MNKKVIVASVLVLSLFVVGLGFVSAQETNIENGEGTTIQNRMRSLMGKLKRPLITPELLEDSEIQEKIAQHHGITIEEVNEIIEAKKEMMENRRENFSKRKGHMGGKMRMGERINKIIEDEELLNKIATEKGISVDELKQWLEDSPLRDKN